MKPHAFLLAVFNFVAASSLRAHETWLDPSTFSGVVGQPLHFDLTSGMKFPALDYAIRPERIAEARVRLITDQTELKPTGRKQHSLSFEHAFARPGIVAAWVTLSPKTLELTDAKVVEYFTEIDASPEVRSIWAGLQGHAKWKETYTKCAKTLLRIGDGGSDDSWKTPVGMPLEIVPLTDPSSLRSGQSAALQLLENGNPLGHITVGLLMDGKRVFRSTAADGRVTIPIAQAGRALLFAVHLRRSTNNSEWRSNFSTLTLIIAPSER